MTTDRPNNEIRVCPECDSPKLRYNPRKITGPTAGGAYHCGECYATTDEPATRRARGRHSPSGMVKALLDASPDDVGGATPDSPTDDSWKRYSIAGREDAR